MSLFVGLTGNGSSYSLIMAWKSGLSSDGKSSMSVGMSGVLSLVGMSCVTVLSCFLGLRMLFVSRFGIRHW